MPSPHQLTFSHRLSDFFSHIPRYWDDAGTRLAIDAGISPSAIYHLMKGRWTPTYRVAIGITEAIGRQLGRELHTSEIFTFTGRFRTPSVCELCGCKGCLPEAAYNEDGTRKAQYRHLKGGDWHMAQQPQPASVDEGGSHE
jgi:hypothetical protein